MYLFVTFKVALNGRLSRLLIDPKIDLLHLNCIDDIYDHFIK